MKRFRKPKVKKVNFKFRSLTMRIWTTFTAIILLIILGISFIYLVIFRRISNEAKMNDLKVAHDMIVESDNIYQPNRLNELHNLMQSRHFILQKDGENSEIIPIQNKMLMPNKEIDDKSPENESITNKIIQNKDIHNMPFSNDRSLQQWMGNFADSKKLNDTEYKQKYNGKEYNFIISYIKEDNGNSVYLISYNPELNDNSLIYAEIVVGLIFIIIGFITSKIVASSIAKPLKELENYTVKIAKKEWGTPIAIDNKDEIGRLAESMNKMQVELKRADEEEKMFLQSISHDLKTPVMVIMSHAEAIMDGIYIDDSVEKTAEIIKDEAVSLDKKIRQMLYLNTLDYVMQNDEDNTDINLRSLITHIVNRLELIKSSISWELNMDDVIMHGNMERIQVAIENIIENGLRYANDTIKISVHRINDEAEIKIYNDGPNIDEQHINNIFDNQYKDKSGNFGLGLAISKKVINFYGGIVYAQNEDVGVTFVIKIKNK